jgi:hypothetical protein
MPPPGFERIDPRTRRGRAAAKGCPTWCVASLDVNSRQIRGGSTFGMHTLVALTAEHAQLLVQANRGPVS